MTELMKFDNASMPMNPDDLMQGLEVAVQQAPVGSGDTFIKMTKTGMWLYGAEDTEVEEGSLWAANPMSFVSGYINWDTREDVTALYGEKMASAFKPPVNPDTLDDMFDGETDKGSNALNHGEWKAQMGFHMQCVSGEDKGQVVLYKNSSHGCLTAVRDLMVKVTAQLQIDKENYVPLITLENGSYVNKKFPKRGETFYPVLEVQQWTTMDGGAVEEEPAKVEEQPEPAKVEEQPEPEEEAPKRRRRRAK